MPPLQPYQIVVEVKPEIRPVDGDELARYLFAIIEQEVDVPDQVGDHVDQVLQRGVDQAIKVFGLVKASGTNGPASSRPTAGAPTARTATSTAPSPPEDPVAEKDRKVVRAQEEPTCFCFGHGNLEGPHIWTIGAGAGCPVSRPFSQDDRWRTITNLLANVACWCPACSSNGGQPSDPHQWNPTGYCPSWAPTVGLVEALPEAWSRDWYGYLEKRLAQVFNGANVEGALDRPDWEIARRLMVEVAKMRRENRRDR